LRAELDGLPVEEKTGLPYASRARVRDQGELVPVMHACGHDVQMAGVVGAASILSRNRSLWRGTLLVVGQPAEEALTGARAMLADGLYRRFPKPAYALSVHASNLLPAGQVGWHLGPSQATADALEVTVFGKGGHGAFPQSTIDPIVIAARVVLALQTIVSRENSPLDPAVITVGSFRAGSRPNIIPEEARLLITVRALRQEVRERLLDAIGRTLRGEALAAGAPREPALRVLSRNDPVVNDPGLGERLATALGRVLGRANVQELPAMMTSDDFSAFATDGVRTFKIFAGAAEPGAFAQAAASGKTLPSNHSPLFAPDRVSTLKTATTAYVAGALELLGRAGR
jgi:hippurate hydrolase